MRTFDSGATRDSDETKPDYEGFLSPLVLERFGQYMSKHRVTADGGLRASDNWQKGIPLDVYMKSAFRHFVEWWKEHREREPNEWASEETEEALCAMLFNVQGYLHELLRAQAARVEVEPALISVWPCPHDLGVSLSSGFFQCGRCGKVV